MKKSTLVRSDKPHAVKMAEGTNVAQRKNVKKTSAPEAPSPAPDNIQKIAPVTAAATKPATVPAIPANPVRLSAKLRSTQTSPPFSPTSHPNPVVKPKAPAKAAAKNPPTTAPLLAPAQAPEPVWEQNNPIKHRIEQLKARNAQLAEQLQRLQSAPTDRGQRP